MPKEFEYTCKTQAEFVQMFIEHKTGFKVNSDTDYEIHIFYKNGKEFHMNANKAEGTFSRTGIKAGIISTELEEIHFGNISDLEYYVEKFNIVSFWKLKALKDENAAIVFEFITEMIDKTKTDKYYSNDKIVRMLRGFKFNTNASFNLFMTLDLHYITEFSFETLVLFSEYMKNQCSYVVASAKQEVASMTTITTKTNTTKKAAAEIQAAADKKAFIKAAKKADLLTLITSLSIVNTEYNDNNELTKLFIKANIHSDYINFVQDVDFVKLLTNDYSTDSDEKKRIQKLLSDFVKTYRNKTKDIHQSLTHSNVQVCILVENDKYIVLKKFNLTIFDIVKIDGLNVLHTALEKSLLFDRQDTTSAGYVTEIIAEINRKIIPADNKPIIRNLREFKKLLYSCRGKATVTKCTYNKSNVTNFISSYVLAAYNNRLPKYTAILKPSKNK